MIGLIPAIIDLDRPSPCRPEVRYIKAQAMVKSLVNIEYGLWKDASRIESQ